MHRYPYPSPFTVTQQGRVVKHATPWMSRNPALSGILAIVVMLAVGVPVFLALELAERRDQDSAAVVAYLAKVEVIETSTALSPQQQEDFVAHLGGPPEVKSDTDYVFQYVLYAFSLMSTIGYGNIYPLNPASRAFTLLYAVVCIPVAGYLFSHTAGIFVEAVQLYLLQKMDPVPAIFRELGDVASLSRVKITKALRDEGAFVVAVAVLVFCVYSIV